MSTQGRQHRVGWVGHSHPSLTVGWPLAHPPFHVECGMVSRNNAVTAHVTSKHSPVLMSSVFIEIVGVAEVPGEVSVHLQNARKALHKLSSRRSSGWVYSVPQAASSWWRRDTLWQVNGPPLQQLTPLAFWASSLAYSPQLSPAAAKLASVLSFSVYLMLWYYTTTHSRLDSQTLRPANVLGF